MGAGEGTDVLHAYGATGGYIESSGSYSVASDETSPRATDGSGSLIPECAEGVRGSGLKRTNERDGAVTGPGASVTVISSPAAAAFSISTSSVVLGDEVGKPLDDDIGDGV